ncbi:MAG: phage portal protein, partial [Ruminococcus sp.]|nr:phage portal protein [Ruminococcus sp.]
MQVQDIGSGVPFMLRNSSAGKTVTTQTAMQLTVVCACVRILAEAVAGLPLHMYRYTENGKEKAIDNRLYYLLHDEPNPEMTSFTFRETMMAQLLTTGNAYAQKIFNNRGEIVAIYPLISAQMQVLRDSSGRLVYLYTYMPDDSKPNETQVVPLRQDEVWNIPGLGFNGLIGFSPIEMARNALGLAMATEEYGSKFFANGAQPSGVLEHPGVIKDAEKLRTA